MKNFLRLFYDIEFYKELKDKTGHPIRQVFILIFLSMIAYSLYFGVNIIKLASSGKDFVLNEMNEFTLEEGKLTVNQKDAIVYQHNKNIFVIDSKNNFSEEDLNKYERILYVNDEKILFKNDNNTTNIDLNSIKLKVDNKIIANLLDNTKVLAYLIFIPVLLYQIISKWLYVVLIGFIGFIILKIMEVEVDFKYILKISAYILTIPTILSIINVVVLNFLIPAFANFNILVIIIYFIAIGKNLKQNDEEKDQNKIEDEKKEW